MGIKDHKSVYLQIILKYVILPSTQDEYRNTNVIKNLSEGEECGKCNLKSRTVGAGAGGP